MWSSCIKLWCCGSPCSPLHAVLNTKPDETKKTNWIL
jgi:hypothetical protein